MVYEMKIINDSSNMKKMISRICDENLLDIDRDIDIIKKQYELIDNFKKKEFFSKKSLLTHGLFVMF